MMNYQKILRILSYDILKKIFIYLDDYYICKELGIINKLKLEKYNLINSKLSLPHISTGINHFIIWRCLFINLDKYYIVRINYNESFILCQLYDFRKPMLKIYHKEIIF